MNTHEQQLIDTLKDQRSHIFNTLSEIFKRDVECGMFYVNHVVINEALEDTYHENSV